MLILKTAAPIITAKCCLAIQEGFLRDVRQARGMWRSVVHHPKTPTAPLSLCPGETPLTRPNDTPEAGRGQGGRDAQDRGKGEVDTDTYRVTFDPSLSLLNSLALTLSP